MKDAASEVIYTQSWKAVKKQSADNEDVELEENKENQKTEATNSIDNIPFNTDQTKQLLLLHYPLKRRPLYSFCYII